MNEPRTRGPGDLKPVMSVCVQCWKNYRGESYRVAHEGVTRNWVRSSLGCPNGTFNRHVGGPNGPVPEACPYWMEHCLAATKKPEGTKRSLRVCERCWDRERPEHLPWPSRPPWADACPSSLVPMGFQPIWKKTTDVVPDWCPCLMEHCLCRKDLGEGG